jgi:two-component system response regulator PilR (NtrC family)
VRWAQRAATTRLPILIQGETGSGKDVVARQIHRASPRHDAPFVGVNCAGLSLSLLAAELFGAVRGAYTGAERDRPGLFRAAHQGTLFLDEIGEMPLAMQTALLRVVQDGRVRPVGGTEEHPVDVRIVSATHRDLADEVRHGRFREDLYHRLAVLVVRVPPLRERIEDLRLLVAALAPAASRDTGCRYAGLMPAAWAALERHAWPGNVRELQAVLGRALLAAGGAEIEARHLGLGRPPGAATRAAASARSRERRMVEEALEDGGGSVATAADLIGWSRQKLYRRARELGLDLDELRRRAATAT